MKHEWIRLKYNATEALSLNAKDMGLINFPVLVRWNGIHYSDSPTKKKLHFRTAQISIWRKRNNNNSNNNNLTVSSNWGLWVSSKFTNLIDKKKLRFLNTDRDSETYP